MTVRSTPLDDVLANMPDPQQGLPDEVFHFIRRVTPLINVDLLIQRGGRTLLAWREDEYATGWHVAGGIIRFRETQRARIDAVARLEFGATVRSEERPCDMNELRQHARGHFISLLYRCELTSEIPAERIYSGKGKPPNGSLGWINGVPDDLYPAQTFYARWLSEA